MHDGIFAAGVDPNIAKDEEKKRPVLFAAERGHWKVLQAFKRHNYELEVLSGQKIKTVKFDVWTKDKDETVLHLALKRPLLRLHQVRQRNVRQICNILKANF